MTRESPPEIRVQLCPEGLRPYSRNYAALLEQYDPPQVFKLVPMHGGRNREHLAKYWVILGEVVIATGLWPTAEHLHDTLKVACGYFTLAYDIDRGETVKVSDSVAVKAMTQAEFARYFEAAMAKLGEVVDPGWLQEQLDRKAE